MKQFFTTLFVLCALCGYANAAILVFSPNGSYTTKTTLEAARTAADAAGKTVVVTSALSAAQSNISSAWPSDRVLKVEKGGSINPTAPFTGLPYAEPEWFGGDVHKAFAAATNVVLTSDYTLTSQLTISQDNTTSTFKNGAKLVLGFNPATEQASAIYISGNNVKMVDAYIDGDSRQSSGINVAGNSFKMTGGTVKDFVGTNAIGIAIGKSADGVTTMPATNAMIDGVTLTGNQYGTYTFGTIGAITNTTVQNCIVGDSGDRGITIVADGGAILNNYVYNNSVTGIYVAGGGTAGQWGKIIIDGNRVISASGVTSSGVKISTGTTNYSFTNNYIDTTASTASGSYFGLYLQGTSKGYVAGNTIYSGLNGAIKIEAHPDPNGSSSADVLVTGNKFITNSATVVAVQGGASAGSHTCTRIKFDNNVITGTYLIAISFVGDYSEITNNTLIGSASTTNMMSLSGSGLTVDGNYFDVFSGSAVRYEMDGATTKDYTGTAITNNTIKEVASPTATVGRIQVVSSTAIATYVIRDTKISGNHIIGGSYGIMLTGAAASDDNNINTIVSDNVITKTVRDGILARGNYAKIFSNTIYDFSQGSSSYSGIAINGDQNTVYNNILENAGTKFRHINITGGATNRLINNFLDDNSISDGGVTTKIVGTVTLP